MKNKLLITAAITIYTFYITTYTGREGQFTENLEQMILLDPSHKFSKKR